MSSATETSSEVRHVATPVHGRSLLSLPRVAPKALLMGFHGFGEAAADLLPVLVDLRGDAPWALCSVQALHPFYRRTGEIVASWMTSLDRELAIADNVEYVRRTLAAMLAELPSVERLAMVGFSQGVAMAYRAAAGCGRSVSAVVALAGDLPPELHSGLGADFPPVLIARGHREEWYSPVKRDRDLQLLRSMAVEVELVERDGGHEWSEPLREAARDFLRRHLGSSQEVTRR